jgi:GMP synthase (glutamine-hydrolysing)
MRIGILQCDDVHASLQAEFGNYPAMLTTMLLNAQATMRKPELLSATAIPTPTVTPTPKFTFCSYDIRRGCYPKYIDECDAYITSGSKYSVNQSEPWIQQFELFIRALLVAKKKLIAICFGHQMVARALAIKVVTRPLSLGLLPHQVNDMDDNGLTQVRLCAIHNEQITALPVHARLFASHASCPYAGFKIEDHVLSIQAHPEFSRDYLLALMALRTDTIAEATYASAMASLINATDADVMVRYMLNFLIQ